MLQLALPMIHPPQPPLPGGKPPPAPPIHVGPGLIIHEGMTREEARLAVLIAGLGFIGGGSYAGFATDPANNRGIRIAKPDRGGEIAYRVFAELPNNPYAPRVYGRVELADGGTAIEVELLDHIDPWNDDEAEEERRASDSAASSYYRLGSVDHLDPDLADLLRALEAARGDCRWDIHEENAMVRSPSGQLVLTDPIYCVSQYSAARCGSGNAVSVDWAAMQSVERFARAFAA